MLPRWLQDVIGNPLLGHKMRFVGGPRQCGKTTMAKSILAARRSEKLYYSWDIPEIRKRYQQDSLFYRKDMVGRKRVWACFDEIHKSRQWKNILKGIYDADGEKLTALITGSARMVPTRRSGDSLAGRYFLFHLSPILCGELIQKKPPLTVPANVRLWLQEKIESEERSNAQEAVDTLLKFGPFPEPLLRGNAQFARLWRRNYLDAVVQGDLRDLTRLQDLELAENVIEMLPHRVGNPFSVNAVREDLGVAFGTIKNILLHLERLFITFSIPPFVKNLKRPVKKEKKIYLFEWSPVEDEALRFENLIGAELLGLVWLWNGSGTGEFSLAFVRNREGKETDFLICRNGTPWCLLECKLRHSGIAAHHQNFARQLGNIPVVQVLREHGYLRARDRDTVEISAARLLG